MREKTCSVDACGRQLYAKELCKAHYKRLVVKGNLRPEKPLRVYGTDGFVKNGYRVVPVPRSERWLTDGQTPVGEHRLVMAQKLQRPIAADESVHHKNGDRLDNRAGNLELWSRWQPSGQRVSDKILAALELLRRYAPELLISETPPS